MQTLPYQFSFWGLFYFFLLLNQQRLLAGTTLIMGSFARPFFWLLVLSESFSPSCCSILLLLKLGSARGSLGWTYCSTSRLSCTFRPLVQTAVCPATCLLPSLLLLHLLLYKLMAVRRRSWLSLQDAASL